MSVSIPTAGELRHRVSIYSRIDHPVNGHEVESIDELICTVFCKIEPTGSMYFNNIQTENKTTHRFWFRSVKGMTDARSLSRSILIKEGDITYIPIRITQCNGQNFFTMVEARELGDIQSETVNANNMAGLADG